MRSLFIKLFLWFGVAMVLVNVASFFTGILTERRFQPPRNHPLTPMMTVFAETAVQIYERDGRPGLRSYLDRVEQTASINAILFDEQGHELSGRPNLENAGLLAGKTTIEKPTVFDPPNPFPPPEGGPPRHPTLMAQLIDGTASAHYVLVGRLPERNFPGPPPRLGESGSLGFGLRVLARTLLPLLLIGGLFCYLLARYLATPIVKLRRTTHELSDGNLGARVDPQLLKRRDEIGYLGQDFNLMATHIESLVGAQRRLLTDISHELRSPLARQGVALGLARRKGNSDVQPSLDRIAREAERMNAMIGQLLDISRVENRTEEVLTTKIDLATLVQEIAQDADYEARDRLRSVRLRECETCVVAGTPDLLSSAIENVVRNAVRHTAEGTEVEISLGCVDGFRPEAVVTVRDHGKGVPDKALTEIFQPFYRVEDARDRKTGGTGLGLAIAARAVRLHGGSISARNADNGGLIVELRLPLS